MALCRCVHAYVHVLYVYAHLATCTVAKWVCLFHKQIIINCQHLDLSIIPPVHYSIALNSAMFGLRE